MESKISTAHGFSLGRVDLAPSQLDAQLIASDGGAAAYDASTSMMHYAIASWFLGPQAENRDRLMGLFAQIVDSTAAGRCAYHPEDGQFISPAVQSTQEFHDQSQRLTGLLRLFSSMLNQYSVPFFSQRYAAHMTFETSLPAIVGYLSTMFTNPNNVAFEASPFTTIVEIEVGNQLCEMLGYVPSSSKTAPWGHITSGGTVANMESMWAARNLKFYPLSLRLGMQKDKLLRTAAARLRVPPTEDRTKQVLFSTLDPWQLFNLRIDVILDLPYLLYDQCGIGPEYCDKALKDYLVQQIGKDALVRKFEETFQDVCPVELRQPQYLISATRHYSWPKAAALTGIGAANLVDVAVDSRARVRLDVLRHELEKRLRDRIPVYAVVAVIGTTEEGAVDPLDKIIELKAEFEAKGMSFVVHADAAWGGYFASMLRKPLKEPVYRGPRDEVYGLPLRTYTKLQFEALVHTDSITIDPHKSGYIPYPAGGLCYKDGRMRQLVTWSAPYINQGASDSTGSIGIFGIEGSKPGAAAAAAFFHHIMIGLHERGHGALLAEVVWTSARISAHWATLSEDSNEFDIVPFNEVKDEDIPIIREKIVGKSNETVYNDAEAREVLAKLGSDLNINAFGCNFRVNGKPNNDVEEANIFGSSIYKALSIAEERKDVKKVPMFISSTTFEMDAYGACATAFKARMGLETASYQDLFVLRNVVMSPFQSAGGFVAEVASIFRAQVEKKLPPFVKRNTIASMEHNFVVQGTGERVFLVYLPNFYDANCRYQLILSADVLEASIPGAALPASAAKFDIPTMCTVNDTTIEKILSSTRVQAVIAESSPSPARRPVVLDNIRVVKKRSLNSAHRDYEYPEFRLAYLYGSPDMAFTDHIIARAPNWQITATKPVQLILNPPLTAEQLDAGVIVKWTDDPERALQPLQGDKLRDLLSAQATSPVEVYMDPHVSSTRLTEVLETDPVAKGTIANTQWPWVWDGLNAAREPWVNGVLFERPHTLEEVLELTPPLPEHAAPALHSHLFGTSRQETWADVVELVHRMTLAEEMAGVSS